MNFFVKKTVLVLVILAVIGTVYAPVYSPGVAERIIKNALVEVKRTGTIKDVTQFKQAYQDLPRMTKEDYQDDYENILKAVQKSLLKKENLFSISKPKFPSIQITSSDQMKDFIKNQEQEKKQKQEERITSGKQEDDKYLPPLLDEEQQEKNEKEDQQQKKSQESEKKQKQKEELNKNQQLQEKANQERLEQEKKEQNKQLSEKEKTQNQEKQEKETLEKELLEKQKLEREKIKEQPKQERNNQMKIIIQKNNNVKKIIGFLCYADKDGIISKNTNITDYGSTEDNENSLTITLKDIVDSSNDFYIIFNNFDTNKQKTTDYVTAKKTPLAVNLTALNKKGHTELHFKTGFKEALKIVEIRFDSKQSWQNINDIK